MFISHEAPAKSLNELPVAHPGRPVGRDDKLKEMYAHLRANKAVLLHGPAGSGKTTLAAALAAAYTQQSGGVLWLNLDDSPFQEMIVRVGRAYQQTDISNAQNPLGMVGAVAALLTQHKPFIVLDGKVNAKAAEQFISRCAENLPAVILSDALIEGPWEPVELGPLSDMDAAVLFKQKAGIADNASDIDVYGIVKLMEYLPFPIVVSARAMAAAKQSPRDYYAVLKQLSDKIEGDSQVTALTASYRSLSSPLQGLLLMIGATFRGEASSELLSMVSGVSPESVDQAISVLTQLYLVEKFQRSGAAYYRLHSRVLDFALTWLKGSNRLEGLQNKFRETVMNYASKYINGGEANYPFLAAEMDNVVAAARHAATEGDRDIANRLVGLLTGEGSAFVKSSGYVYELLSIRNAASGFTTAFPAYPQEAPPEVDEEEDFDEDDFILDEEDEDVFDFLGEDEDDEDEDDYAGDFDEYDEDEEIDEDDEQIFAPRMSDPLAESLLPTDTGALQAIDVDQLRAALGRARQQKDMIRQVQILKAIGKVQMRQNKENEAITTYNELLTAYETIGENDGVLEALDTLSALLTRTDNSQAAVLHATRGLQLAEELDDDEAKLRLLLTLGDARQNLGESAQALKDFEQALSLSRTLSDGENEALALYRLGYAQLDNGDPETAIETWEMALSHFKTQKKREYEGRVLGGLGQAYSELNRWSEAINFHNSALYIARELGDREEESLQLTSLGHAMVESNRLPDALLRYRQALHLAYQSGVRSSIISAIVELVQLMLRSKRLLTICELLIEDAVRIDPNDKDVRRLNERVASEKAAAEAEGLSLADVTGTARDYAYNAYKLLDA